MLNSCKMKNDHLVCANYHFMKLASNRFLIEQSVQKGFDF